MIDRLDSIDIGLLGVGCGATLRVLPPKCLLSKCKPLHCVRYHHGRQGGQKHAALTDEVVLMKGLSFGICCSL